MICRVLRALIPFVLVLGVAGVAEAQAVDLRAPDPAAIRLTETRLAHYGTRRDENLVLLVGGLGSLAAGAVVTGVLADDPFALGFGIGTMVWGAVNAIASLLLLDLDGAERGRIEQGRRLRGEALSEARLTELRDRDAQSAIWALNLGLDVLYVVSGALLFLVADQLEAPSDREATRGYALAQLCQGGLLFAFDLAGWIVSAAQASDIDAIAVP